MGTRGFRGERKRYTRRGKEEARILDRRRHCTVELVQRSFPSLLMAFGTAWIHGRKRAERLER